uniref:RlpA-like protein double-psi beta-barrel domain-containing protein n=1 Tax=Psilocybe cubensis TaxID=181762 RepID=A0A8H8CG68_PSICU
MCSRIFSIIALLYAFCVISLVNAHPGSHHGSFLQKHNGHNQLHNRLISRNNVTESSIAPQVENRRRIRNSCVRKPQDTISSTSITSSHVLSTQTPKPSSTNVAATKTAKLAAAGIQASAAPTAVRTSPADPYLLELSKPYNNANNPLFNKVYVGQMTYYAQGLGACGDTYDDSSFTAAVSKLLYDAWPGATASRNRNPICGPYVGGRKIINDLGLFVTAVPGSEFINIGGDGFPNCDPQSQCHVPLTATVKHGNKSIQVKIVDRCEACAEGDIDLTPTAFAALADMSLGRTSVEWSFNK